VPDPELIAEVERVSHNDPIGLLRNVARDTLRQLRERMGGQSRLGDLRKQLEELQAEQKKVKADLAELQARLAATGRNGGRHRPRRVRRAA
jgi:predicted nuclease with TOPRIM domain